MDRVGVLAGPSAIVWGVAGLEGGAEGSCQVGPAQGGGVGRERG